MGVPHLVQPRHPVSKILMAGSSRPLSTMGLLLLLDPDTTAALATAALARRVRKIHGGNGVKLRLDDPGNPGPSWLIYLTLSLRSGTIGTIPARFAGLKSDV